MWKFLASIRRTPADTEAGIRSAPGALVEPDRPDPDPARSTAPREVKSGGLVEANAPGWFVRLRCTLRARGA